jgi:hypothetical protein
VDDFEGPRILAAAQPPEPPPPTAAEHAQLALGRAAAWLEDMSSASDVMRAEAAVAGAWAAIGQGWATLALTEPSYSVELDSLVADPMVASDMRRVPASEYRSIEMDVAYCPACGSDERIAEEQRQAEVRAGRGLPIVSTSCQNPWHYPAGLASQG